MREERFLIFKIKSLNNEIKRLLDPRALADNIANLTGMQCAMLGFINEMLKYGDVFQRDIEAEFNIRRSTASTMMAFLEKNEYITRTPVAEDKRLKRIELTDKAKRVDNSAKANIHAVEKRLLRGIDDSEMKQFYATLTKIFENAK